MTIKTASTSAAIASLLSVSVVVTASAQNLVLSFGVVALLLVSIFRSGKRSSDPVDDLIEEVRRSQKPRKVPSPAATPETREPWEKDGDWWKK